MPVTLKSNSTNDEMELDITTEVDDSHVFLAFSGTDPEEGEEGEEVLDFILEGDKAIQEFFRMIDKARKDFERQVI